jgi:CheY-like chemotaxis protein
MASLPRIITVDPTGSIPQQIRAAFDLMDRLVIQIDVPSANEALDELQHGDCDAVIAAWEPGDGMQGWELAANIKQITPETAIMLLGDYDDTEFDEDTHDQSPFVYLKRPFDIPQLIRVLKAAMEGRDIFQAVRPPVGEAAALPEMGSVPGIDADRADEVMQGVMTDLNPIAAMLGTRKGDIVVGRGTSDYINYDEIATTVVDAVLTNINLRDLIGGNAQSLQFFDGDEYDLFVLSVGLHHFLAIIFDGQSGSRQLGPVSRFGRRRAEDLIGILGANAWLLQRPVADDETEDEQRVRRKSRPQPTREEADEDVPELARAEFSTGEMPAVEAEIEDVPEEAPAPEPALPTMQAIDDDEFDPDLLFGDDFDEAEADELFDPDTLGELARVEGRKGTIDQDEAERLGLLKE